MSARKTIFGMSPLTMVKAGVASLAVLLLAGSQIAHAAKFTGIQLSKKVGTRDVPVFTNAGYFEIVLKNAWVNNRSKIDRIIEKKLPEINPKLPRKVGVYKQHSTVSANTQFLGAVLENGSIRMRMLVKGNSLTFYTTTPTIFGSYADPKFVLTYDLELNVLVPLTANIQNLQASSVVATIKSFHWKTKNVLVAIKSLFSGTGFITNAIKGKSFDITKELNKQLNPFNVSTQALKKQGFKTWTTSVDAKSKKLKLIATAPKTVALGKKTK